MKKENKGVEMIDILTETHQYVPSFQCGEKVYEFASVHNSRSVRRP